MSQHTQVPPDAAPLKHTLGLIGCGHMGGGLLQGWLRAGLVDPTRVLVASSSSGPALAVELDLPIAPAAEVVRQADVLLIAVKPHQFAAVTRDLPFHRGQLVISVLAGLRHADLARACAPARVVRTMPNVAAAVGASHTLVLSADLSAEDRPLVQSLMGAVGAVEFLDEERWFHPGTALAGCAPAFLFMAMEALADAGVAEGLPRPLAQRLAAGAVLSAGQLAQQRPGSSAILKDHVSSPGGATIQGVRSLERAGLRSAFFEAAIAASQRSQALEEGT